MSKVTIVQDMLWKYPDIGEPGTKLIDFDTHLICYSLFEFDDNGDQIADSVCITKLFGDVSNISLGLKEALRTMKIGEQALFEINQYYKFSEQQVLCKVELQEKINQSCKNQFWLIKIEKVFPQNLSVLSNFEELNETINLIRTYANQLFGQMHYQQCIILYNVISTINLTNCYLQDQVESLRIEISKSYSNQAICYSKLKDWLLMCEMCLKALSYNDKNEKAQFLFGKANFELGKKQDAEEQFLKYKQFFPQADHREVNHYLKRCQSDLQINHENKIQQFYSNRRNEIEFDNDDY